VSKDQRVGLRNFFVQHAALAHTNCRATCSLKGLKLIDGADIPAVRLSSDSRKTVQFGDSGSKNVKFEIVDAFGKPFVQTENAKVSIADLSDNKAGLKDITSQVKFSNSVATW
jgi:hypothetical protein